MSRDAPSTARYFDACAPIWERNYAPEGSMRERVSQFCAAIGARVAPPASVLDFGCGTGDIARALAAAGYAMTGCDLSPAMIEAARARSGGPSYVGLDAARLPALPFADGQFDAVMSSSVFEYLPDPVAQLRELRRVLKPGGWLLATVPDPRHPLRVEEDRERARIEAAWWRGLFARLPLRLRSRTRTEYLLRSGNRFALEGWRREIEAAGLACAAFAPCAGPLVLIEARAAVNG